MKKLTIWCLILAMMLSLFVGCGQTEPVSAPASEPAEAVVSAPAPEPEPKPEPVPEASAAEESVVEEPVEEPAQFVEVSLPIATEPVTFSLWYTWPPVLANFIDGPGSTPFAQEAEEYTAIMSDIETYMEETITSVLVGNAPLSELDEMAENLTAMNIEEAIALMQASYDRYLTKAE